MQAMLLAAGFGTRLRPYTLIRPKPMFPVLNVPLLHILLDKLLLAGCRQVVVNCHHLAEQIEAAVAGRPEVILQFEPEILGTGGSLRKALPLFTDEPILVMNGDIYHDIDVQKLMIHHTDAGLPVTMAMHDYDRFNSVAVQDNRVIGFSTDCSVATKNQLAFTGIHILNRDVIEKIPENGFFHIIDLYKQLAQAGRIGSVRVDNCFWRDIGTAADYLDLHRQLLNNKLNNKQDKKNTCDTKGNWIISEQTTIGDDVVFRDWGAVGSGVVIGDGCRLRRCVIWDNVKIASGQQLTDTIVCRDIHCTDK